MRLDTGTRLFILLAACVVVLVSLGVFLPEYLPALLGNLRHDTSRQ